MRVDENGVLRLDEDIEKLIIECKPQEAYDLLCSKYPSDVVERIQTGRMTPEDDFIIPTLDAMEVFLGADDFRVGIFGTTPYEHLRNICTRNPDLAEQERAQEVKRQLLILSSRALQEP